jgi:hypothetical protein
MFADIDQAAKATRDPVAPAQRSQAALEWAASRIVDDGTPVRSFATLMAELGSVVRNTCRHTRCRDASTHARCRHDNEPDAASRARPDQADPAVDRTATSELAMAASRFWLSKTTKGARPRRPLARFAHDRVQQTSLQPLREVGACFALRRASLSATAGEFIPAGHSSIGESDEEMPGYGRNDE